MRLYPPVPFMSRTPIKDDLIGNLRIPRGTLVTIAPYVLHRHRTLWDEADAFVPERFLPDRRSRIDRFGYLPFGAGPRVCIGSSFALQEATVLLAHLARAARLDPVPGHPIEPVHRVTLRPKGGLPMRFRRRVAT